MGDINLFIGSSSKGLPLARAIKEEIREGITVVIWEKPNGTGSILPKILKEMEKANFGLFILTDDLTITKTITGKAPETYLSPTTNVLSEIGAFVGSKNKSDNYNAGIDRLILLFPNNHRDLKLFLPSDFDSIENIKYDYNLLSNTNGEYRKSLCRDIENKIDSLNSVIDDQERNISTTSHDGANDNQDEENSYICCLNNDDINILKAIHENKLSSRFPLIPLDQLRVINKKNSITTELTFVTAKLIKNKLIEEIINICSENIRHKYFAITDVGMKLLIKELN